MGWRGRAEQVLVGLGDGVYDTRGIWRQLPGWVIRVIRCARNRGLWALPKVPSGRRDAPAKYGPRQEEPWKHLG